MNDIGAHEPCGYEHEPWECRFKDNGEHSCHEHPLGATEFTYYWCGHRCVDALCRRYKFVWSLLHPLALIRHMRGLNYAGLKR